MSYASSILEERGVVIYKEEMDQEVDAVGLKFGCEPQGWRLRDEANRFASDDLHRSCAILAVSWQKTQSHSKIQKKNLEQAQNVDGSSQKSRKISIVLANKR